MRKRKQCICPAPFIGEYFASKFVQVFGNISRVRTAGICAAFSPLMQMQYVWIVDLYKALLEAAICFHPLTI